MKKTQKKSVKYENLKIKMIRTAKFHTKMSFQRRIGSIMSSLGLKEILRQFI